MDIKNNFTSIEQITNQYLSNQTNKPINNKNEGLSFNQVLEQTRINSRNVSELKFSKHADLRLAQRNISLSEDQISRLNEGAKRAMEKGINESLVIMDDLTFIVNVKNSTVVTAMDMESSKENVFTNIDGAVII
ncbi:MAG: flagellar protein [Lachnospiraceae bacterium]|nr:flagellar protein [Lachnospiraceae bacterium]